MLKIRTRKSGLTSSAVLPTNPEESIVRIKKWRGDLHSCIARPQSWVTINSDLFSAVDWERAHGQLYKSIRFTGRSESKKDKTGLFLLSSELARTVIATEFDQLKKDSMMNRERTEMNKHTEHPDNHRTYHFNLRRAHNSNLVFQSGSDAIILSDKMPASALDKVCHFCRRCFVRKETPDFNQAGGDTWRTNCLAHIMSS